MNHGKSLQHPNMKSLHFVMLWCLCIDLKHHPFPIYLFRFIPHPDILKKVHHINLK